MARPPHSNPTQHALDWPEGKVSLDGIIYEACKELRLPPGDHEALAERDGHTWCFLTVAYKERFMLRGEPQVLHEGGTELHCYLVLAQRTVPKGRNAQGETYYECGFVPWTLFFNMKDLDYLQEKRPDLASRQTLCNHTDGS